MSSFKMKSILDISSGQRAYLSSNKVGNSILLSRLEREKGLYFIISVMGHSSQCSLRTFNAVQCDISKYLKETKINLMTPFHNVHEIRFSVDHWYRLSKCESRSQNAGTPEWECKLCQSCRIGWQVPRCLAHYSLTKKMCFSIKIMGFSC